MTNTTNTTNTTITPLMADMLVYVADEGRRGRTPCKRDVAGMGRSLPIRTMAYRAKLVERLEAAGLLVHEQTASRYTYRITDAGRARLAG